ncbi:MAG: antibiotic biosynthesis monooxygenase [Microbacteriaceae bacterium]|jgi:quinol monooxygenase YgiN|nr:antibiotic biosynthesis monooxygenase [Microbacteriaceae bacterium]
MTQLQAIARYVVPEEKHDQVLTLLREVARQSREEPGNISFDIFENIDDPTRIVLLERYHSREAFAAHRETSHFHSLVLERIVPLLAERSVEELDADDE